MRALGLDLGERRVGLAISDPTCTLARPLKTLARRGTLAQLLDQLVGEIQRLQVEEDGLETLVVGVPTRLDGSANTQTGWVHEVAAYLEQRTHLRVVLQNERLTSREAESKLAWREKDWRKRKLRLDAAAAAVILQEYLDSLGV